MPDGEAGTRFVLVERDFEPERRFTDDFLVLVRLAFLAAGLLLRDFAVFLLFLADFFAVLDFFFAAFRFARLAMSCSSQELRTTPPFGCRT
jgi:hypothetical protein